MKTLFSLLFILFISTNSFANKNSELENILIVSKVTGTCGVFKQLSYFQSTTQMKGGDEFLVRFFNTEATRLGKTLPQMLEECNESVRLYTSLMKSVKKEN